MTADPLIPASQYGLRAWSVVGEPGAERLSSVHHDGEWPPGGWLVASCPHADHEAPAHDCTCGIHAWHPRLDAARQVLAVRGQVAGVVEAVDAVEIHDEGFRARRGRPHALVTGRMNPALVRRLAALYGAEVIESADPAALLAWCRERGLGLDESVVSELIGADAAQLRRERRRRRVRRDALRLAAVVLAIAALVGAGTLVTDHPGNRTLYGRTGPVQR